MYNDANDATLKTFTCKCGTRINPRKNGIHIYRNKVGDAMYAKCPFCNRKKRFWTLKKVLHALF